MIVDASEGGVPLTPTGFGLLASAFNRHYLRRFIGDILIFLISILV
jgi:hypothetical protein